MALSINWTSPLSVLSSEEDIEESILNIHFKFSLMDMGEVSTYVGVIVPIFISLYYTRLKHRMKLLGKSGKNLIVTLSSLVSGRISSFYLQSQIGKEIYVSNGGLRVLLRVLSEPLFPPLLPAYEKANNAPIPTPAAPSVNTQVLHDPGQGKREADVIFIHGIKGALEKTWTQGMTNDFVGELSKCWPRDWLPMDCPRVRIIALNYTTDPYLWRPFWIEKSLRTPMSERSWEMIESLIKIGVGENSIIWVGHSKGGLYAKQILVNACESNKKEYRTLSQLTRGVLFYSVPHRGSFLANLNLPLLRQSVELTEVQKDCTNVITLHEKFKRLIDMEQLKLNVKSLIETQHTQLSFIYVRIVSEESADAQIGETIGVPLDHRNICKPRSRDCFLYRELVNLIEATCSEISLKILNENIKS